MQLMCPGMNDENVVSQRSLIAELFAADLALVFLLHLMFGCLMAPQVAFLFKSLSANVAHIVARHAVVGAVQRSSAVGRSALSLRSKYVSALRLQMNQRAVNLKMKKS